MYNHTADARPSLLGRNPRTRQYVLWAKGNSFQVATAPTLRGPYTTVGNFRPSESCNAVQSESEVKYREGEMDTGTARGRTGYVVGHARPGDLRVELVIRVSLLHNDRRAPIAKPP